MTSEPNTSQPGSGPKLTQSHLQQALGLCPTPLMLIDRGGEIVFTNIHAARLLGYSVQELTGKSVDELVPEDIRGGHAELRDAFLETRSGRRMGNARDLSCIRKDGSKLSVEIALQFTELEGDAFVVVTMVDVSARTLAERRSHQMLQALPTGMLVIDRSGDIQLCNEQAEKILEYDAEELVGQPIEVVVPKDVRRRHSVYREGYQVQPSRRSMGANRDLYALTKSGRHIPVDIGLAPVESATGPQVMASISDISVHRNAELELRKRGEALRRANEELMAFAYSASHDLKSPLTSISGLLTCCTQDLEKNRIDEVTKNIGRCHTLAARLASRIESLLTLARADSLANDGEEIDLDELVRHAAQTAIPQEMSAHVEITTEFKHTGPIISVPSRLEVIFENLISNAVKYRKADDTHPKVTLTSQDLGESRVQLSVIDRGRGIPEEFQNRIFDLFTRGSEHNQPGSGLGLAIVHKHVLALEGEIRVESSPTGSAFVIEMPRHHHQGRSDVEAADSETSAQRN